MKTVLCIKGINSVDIDSMECIKDPCLVSTVSTYIVFDGMVEKPSVSACQNFFRIENQLNIYGQECVDVFCIDSVDIDSIECTRDPCLVSTVLTYIILMLKSPKSQPFKTFFGLKIG